MVVLGRRIARGVRERWNQGVSDRSEWPEPESERERRSGEPARSRSKLPVSAGIGALRGVPVRTGEGETQTRTRGKTFSRPLVWLLVVGRISLNPELQVPDVAIDGLCALWATYSFQHQR